MFNKLVEAKEILVNYLQKTDFDEEAIEYLIDTIDYLITGKIPASVEVLNIFLSDVVVTGTYHRGTQLLKVSSIIEQLIKEIKCTK